MKSNHPLYRKLQQCLDTMLAHKTPFVPRLLALVAFLIFCLMILLVFLIQEPGAIEVVAGATAAVLTAPSLPLALALFIGGGVFAAAILAPGRW